VALKINDSVRSATWRISQKLLIVVVGFYRIYDPKRLNDVIEAIFRSKSPVENEIISVVVVDGAETGSPLFMRVNFNDCWT
jgi:hypothetical protein